MKTFLEIVDEANKRVELKNLVWDIYQDPKKVEQAIEALKQIVRK